MEADLAVEWPDPNLLDVLPRHVAGGEAGECFGVWVMVERASGTVVGDIGFHGPPDDAGTVEVGYSVVPSRRGRRYATEAAVALVDWALALPSVQAVVAGCDAGNVPSIRTLERAGFRRTGETEGELRWRRAKRPDPAVSLRPQLGSERTFAAEVGAEVVEHLYRFDPPPA